MTALERLARRICWLEFSQSERCHDPSTIGATEASYWDAVHEVDKDSYIQEAHRWIVGSQSAQIIKAMLMAEPHLPKEPSDELVVKISRELQWERSVVRELYRALYAHLSAPPKPEPNAMNHDALRDRIIASLAYLLRAEAKANRAPPKPEPTNHEPGPMMPPRLRWHRKHDAISTWKDLQYWHDDEWHDVPTV